MDITAIENALHTWVTDATGVSAIHQYPNAPRPAKPYIAIEIAGLEQAGGPDYLGQPVDQGGGTYEAELGGNREITVQLQSFADTKGQAANLLNQAANALAEPPVREKLAADAGLAFVDRLGESAIPGELDTRWEDRYSLDLLFRVGDARTVDLGHIDSTEVTGTVNDQTGGTVEQDTDTIS